MSQATTAVAAEIIGQLYGLKGNNIEDVCEPLSAITGRPVTQATLDDWRSNREDAPPEVLDYLRAKLAEEEESLHG